MYIKSSTNTPAPPRRKHEEIGDSITWVKDWYIPENFHEEDNGSLPANLKLKGWFRTQPDQSSISNGMCQADSLDLDKWKYYNEVPIIDHSIKVEESEPEIEHSKNELESALLIDKNEGQISGLGGIDST